MDRPRFRAAFFHPRFWLLWLGLGVLWLVVQLPYKLQLCIGRVLGALMYRVASDRRRIAARNLELCFPEKSDAERKQLLKDNFASTGIAFFENGHELVVVQTTPGQAGPCRRAGAPQASAA